MTGEDHIVKYYLCQNIPKVRTINMVYHCWHWASSPGWGHVSQASLAPPFPSFLCASNLQCIAHKLNSEKLCSTSLDMEHRHMLFGIFFAWEIIYSRICLCIHLFLSVWTHIYFILQVVTNTTLFCHTDQLWLLGILSVGPCVPLTYPHNCVWVFSVRRGHFLTF